MAEKVFVPGEVLNADDVNDFVQKGEIGSIAIVTSSTRPVSPSEGQVIYETDTDSFFGWKGSAWASIGGGATGGGLNAAFYENETNVTDDYTITTGYNAGSFGPITIDSGVTVTIPAGSEWSVI